MTDFYGIHCKTMDDTNTFISSVGVSFIGANGEIVRHRMYSRNGVIALIETGYRVYTIVLNGSYWTLGAEVKLFPIGDTIYLRTEENEEERDNLGELPDC